MIEPRKKILNFKWENLILIIGNFMSIESKLKLTLVQLEQLTPEEKAILEQKVNLPPEKIDKIFRSEPMFQYEGEDPANKNIPHDLIFIIKPDEDDEYAQQLIADVSNNCQKRFAYVYNCINPDDSEFGTVGFDKKFKYRVF